jgi:hypothetical protein
MLDSSWGLHSLVTSTLCDGSRDFRVLKRLLLQAQRGDATLPNDLIAEEMVRRVECGLLLAGPGLGFSRLRSQLELERHPDQRLVRFLTRFPSFDETPFITGRRRLLLASPKEAAGGRLSSPDNALTAAKMAGGLRPGVAERWRLDSAQPSFSGVSLRRDEKRLRLIRFL